MAAAAAPRLRHGRDGFNNGVRRGGRPEDVPVRCLPPAREDVGQDDVGGRRPIHSPDEISARSDLETRLACEGRQSLLLLEGPRDVAAEERVNINTFVEVDEEDYDNPTLSLEQHCLAFNVFPEIEHTGAALCKLNLLMML